MNFVYWWATRYADERDKQKFDTKLWLPLPGEVPDEDSPWSAENEDKALAAFEAEFATL